MLLCLAWAASAAEPLPATRQAAGAWYLAEGPRIDRAMEPLRAELWALQLEPDAERAESRRGALCARAREAAAAVQAIRPFDPDDRVRASAGAEAERIASTCEGDLRAWIALRAPVVADEDLAAAVVASREGELKAAALATDEATQAFGAAWGLQIPRPSRERAEFQAPGLVPAGSEAPARQVVQLALAYDRQLQPIVGAVDASWRAWWESLEAWDPGVAAKHAEARAKVARARAALDRIGPWLGDPALRDAAAATLASLDRALAGPGAEATAAAARGLHQASEVDRQRPRLEAARAEAEAARAAWAAAKEAFARRWAFQAYRDWLPR